MLANYNIHTDLALEDKERFESDQIEISGVQVKEFWDEKRQIRITEVKIVSENGARTMNKPIGTYLTLEMANFCLQDEEEHIEVAKVMAKQIRELLPREKKEYTALVVGLGNREVTPDALGPKTVERLHVTRHIIREYGTCAVRPEKVHMVSAISPGVMAQTGMESGEIIKGIVNEIKPDLVFVVDALAARNTRRLNRTIQIADTGIHPGSGVGNHRKEISRQTLGIPVIAIGVPTVVDAATIVRDIAGEQELIAPHLLGMFVTPKDIDEAVERIGTTIAMGLDLLFSDVRIE